MHNERTVISGKAARGGEINLRTPLARGIFIAGLAGFAILALLAA